MVKISIFAESITKDGKLFRSTIILGKKIADNWCVH